MKLLFGEKPSKLHMGLALVPLVNPILLGRMLGIRGRNAWVWEIINKDEDKEIASDYTSDG